MRSNDPTKFEKTANLGGVLLILAAVALATALILAAVNGDGSLTLIVIGLTVLFVALVAGFAWWANRKRASFATPPPTGDGLFARICLEFQHDSFKFRLIHDRMGDPDYDGEAIDLVFSRNGREFGVLIDENCVHIRTGEETDCPVEAVMPLDELGSPEAVYAWINGFTAAHI